MFARIAPEDSARVLAVVPTPQFSGHAVVDGWGLAPGSFATWKLGLFATNEARIRSFNRHLLQSLRRHRPAILVLGIPRQDEPRSQALRHAAIRLAVAHGVPAIVRPVTEARCLFLGRQRGSRDDTLAACVVTGFFPELGPFRNPKQTIQRRYRCHSFEAVALALHELVERTPLSAAVISKDDAFAMGRFNAALTESARRHFPDNL